MVRLCLSSAAGLVLLIAPALGYPLSQSSNPSGTTQNSQDVPKQQPGTNSPDVSKQRDKDKSSPRTGTTQQSEDVPHQKPGSNNPDVSKQRHHSGKKKSGTATDTSSSTHI